MTPATLRLHAVALAGELVPPEDTRRILAEAADVLEEARDLARSLVAELATTDDNGWCRVGPSARALLLEAVRRVTEEEPEDEEEPEPPTPEEWLDREGRLHTVRPRKAEREEP